MNKLNDKKTLSVIRMEGVTKIYEDTTIKVKALSNISLTINSGEFVAIIGESGSGKSTFLSVIAGLDSPTIGNIYVNGKDYKKLKIDELSDLRRKNISVIHQFYNLIPILTVKENIILQMEIGLDEINYDKLEDILVKFKLKSKEDVLVTKLSRWSATKSSYC